MAKIKIGFVSLGCAKNQIDTEVMLAHLDADNFEITAEETEADIIIINTCAFIESAKQESIDSILDIAWLKKNRSLKKIIVTGCLSERYREEIFNELPEVDAIVGVGSIHKICEAVKKSLDGEKYSAFDDKEKIELGGNRIITTPPYTAYLKIAEGCDNRCTYCAIPLIRGKFRSRPMEDIIAEAKKLDADGTKELNIIAQDTSRYGEDLYGKYMLAELVRKITDSTSIPWIRLLYCYPDKITEELVAEMKNNKRVLHYIDVPIQHINDDILLKMNRHGSKSLIEEKIALLRREIPDIVIRTTAIVGFPGESEEQFSELCDFVKKTKFERFGAFAYSREEDTPAYDFDGQIDEQTKNDRLDEIMSIQSDVSRDYNESLVGKVFDVICEGYDEVAEAYVGRSYACAPDIDGKVFFDLSAGRRKHKEGDLLKVKITDFEDYDLIGESIK